MIWPASWDQGAWSLATTIFGVFVGLGAFVQAGRARTYAKRAAQAAGFQGLIAAVSRLGPAGQQLTLVAKSENRELADFILSQWTSTAAESLGLLTETVSDLTVLENRKSLQRSLNSSIGLARVSQDKLLYSSDSVALCMRWTLDAINESITTGTQFLAEMGVSMDLEVHT